MRKPRKLIFEDATSGTTREPKEGLEKAIGFFQQAIAREPNYALAYSGLADSYVLLGSRSFMQPKEAFYRAKTEAIKALALDNMLPEAHAAPAFAGLYYDWEWAETEREFRRAIELNPNYTNAHHWYSHFLITQGRFEESLAESKKCIELDPLDPGMRVHLGEHFLYARRYEEAISQLLKAIEMDASRYRAHDDLGRAYEQKGMHAQALAEFKQAVSTSDQSSAMLASLAAGYAASMELHDALRIVRRLKMASQNEYVPAYSMAEVHAVLGDKDEAFAWLGKAYKERSSALVYLKVEPRLDGLRSDVRFQDLVRRMRL
jgi:tetratricopeptide (TPR) repeat protein